MSYRDSILKHAPEGLPYVVTQATFELAPEDPAVITARLDEIRHWRQAHQPLGMPSAGSTFRNPEGDSAGRLIDSLGLKGMREGGASVSEKHANFVVNDQGGTAADVRRVGDRVRAQVRRAAGCRPRVRDRVRGRLVGMAESRDGYAPPAATADARRGAPGWPVRRARRVAGIRSRHRSRACGRGHPVQAWLIDLDGGWWRLPPAALDPAIAATSYDDPQALGASGPCGAAAALGQLASQDVPPVVFPALHGPFGEDGTVQALVASAGLVCCGSGPAASAVGMDKTLFKRLCAAMDLPVAALEGDPARDWSERRRR